MELKDRLTPWSNVEVLVHKESQLDRRYDLCRMFSKPTNLIESSIASTTPDSPVM
jgi:hypothetical protein